MVSRAADARSGTMTAMTQIGFGTTLERQTEQELQSGSGPKAHIVKRRPDDDRDAIVAVMDARLNGTPLEALCGYVWVPSRDPKSLPLCEECKAIFDLHGDLGDHGGGDADDLPS